MRRALLLSVSLVCASLFAQSDLLSLDSTVNRVQQLVESRKSLSLTAPFDLQPLKELDLLVTRQAQLRGGYYVPSFDAVREELEPLRLIAKQLAESGQPGERYYGAVLNSYLKQTDETRALLLKLAHDEAGETAGTAMDTLFGLKQDTPELRAELVRALTEDKSPREHSTMYAMARNNAGKWGLKEAVPVLRKLLEDSAAGGKPVDRDIVRQLTALGSDAVETLPLLRELAQKRKTAGDADFREIEDLENAVLVVSGQYKAPGLDNSTAMSQQSGGDQFNSPLKSAKPASKVPSHDGQRKDEPSYTVFWLAGLLILGTITLLVIKRRS